MDVFGPTVSLHARPQSIQERFRAHADEAVGHFAFWHDQNMAWLQSHLEDLQAQQKQKKSLAALMQSPAKKVGPKHTEAAAAGLQSPFAIQPSTSSSRNIFGSKARSPSPDKENMSPSQARRSPSPGPPTAAARSKRPLSAMQSPAKSAGQPKTPGKMISPMHKKTKMFPGSPSPAKVKSPEQATAARLPTASLSIKKKALQAIADSENVEPPSQERQRVVSAASVNTSGDDEDAMVEASLLAASSPHSRATPAGQHSKLPTPASSKVQNASNISRSTTPPFSPENDNSSRVKSPIRSGIPSPRALPSRAASPRTIPQSPSSKAMPPPASTKSIAKSSPLKTAHRQMISLDSDDDEVQELAKPMSPRAVVAKPQSGHSKTPSSSSAVGQPSSLRSNGEDTSQQTLKQPKSTSSIKDKATKRPSVTIPQSPVSAFLASHQSRPSGLTFKGTTRNLNENGNTSLFAPQPAGHASLHYTSKAFTSMTYSKEKERDENLPSRVLPPSLFSTATTTSETKDVEVPLKDEPSSQPGRSRVEALMNKVESLTKSMGQSRASAIQRGDLSVADMSVAGPQSQPNQSVRPTHSFVRHESQDSHSRASTSFFSANDSQTSRTTEASHQPDSNRSSFAAPVVVEEEDDLIHFDETRVGATPLAAHQAPDSTTPGFSPSRPGKITESESTLTIKQGWAQSPAVVDQQKDKSFEAEVEGAPKSEPVVEPESQPEPPFEAHSENDDKMHDDDEQAEDGDDESMPEDEQEEEQEEDEVEPVGQKSTQEPAEEPEKTVANEPTPVSAPRRLSQASHTSERDEAASQGSASSLPRPSTKTPSLKPQGSNTALKAIQRAAAAKEKEQQERERKNAIKEEREQQRRLMAIAKQQEEERANKARAEAQAERKRKEPEETSKAVRPPSSASKGQPSQTLKIKAPQAVVAAKAKTSQIKPTEDPAKRRRVESDAAAGPSKPTIKIPAQPARPGTALGKYSTASASSSQTVRKAEPSQLGKSTMASATKAKAPATAKPAPTAGSATKPLQANKVPLPKTVGKLKVPQKVASPPPPAIEEPEEVYEELPDINSEYSDSDDDTQAKKTASYPDWAQSPSLFSQLKDQQKLNPDFIFGAGPAPKVKLEEIFQGRKHQFRARSSSAHWSGPDALSRSEEVAYAKRMNFVPMPGGSQQ